MKKDELYNIFIYTVVSEVLVVDVVFPFFPIFRYLKYLGLLFFIILLAFGSFKGLKINDRAKPFLLLIINSLILFPLLTQQGVFELIFIFAGIAMFLFKTEFHFNMEKLSYYAAFMFVVFYAFRGKYNFSAEAFYASDTSSVEGGLSFIYGFLAIYFWEKKKKWHFLLNFILVLLSLKRIVFIGVIVVIFLTLSPKRLHRFITNRIFLIVFNMAFIIIIHLFVNGYFDEFLRNLTGLSIGQFTGGRNTLYSLVLDGQVFSGLDYLLGIGQGGTTNILANYFGHVFLLHNDIIKIAVEHGYLIFVLFLFMLYQTKNEKVLRLTIFLNILFLTDNTLIYQAVYLMYFLIVHKYEQYPEARYIHHS